VLVPCSCSLSAPELPCLPPPTLWPEQSVSSAPRPGASSATCPSTAPCQVPRRSTSNPCAATRSSISISRSLSHTTTRWRRRRCLKSTSSHKWTRRAPAPTSQHEPTASPARSYSALQVQVEVCRRPLNRLTLRESCLLQLRAEYCHCILVKCRSLRIAAQSLERSGLLTNPTRMSRFKKNVLKMLRRWSAPSFQKSKDRLCATFHDPTNSNDLNAPNSPAIT
jgi:hypothetical protein